MSWKEKKSIQLAGLEAVMYAYISCLFFSLVTVAKRWKSMYDDRYKVQVGVTRCHMRPSAGGPLRAALCGRPYAGLRCAAPDGCSLSLAWFSLVAPPPPPPPPQRPCLSINDINELFNSATSILTVGSLLY